MPRRRDPLGKRALFWLGDVQASGASRAAGDVSPPAGGVGPPGGGAAGRGKQALFSGTAERAGHAEQASSDPLLNRGPVAVGCPECGVVSRIGALDFVLYQLPLGVWLPRGRFSHWMTCPACRRRVWASVSLRSQAPGQPTPEVRVSG